MVKYHSLPICSFWWFMLFNRGSNFTHFDFHNDNAIFVFLLKIPHSNLHYNYRTENIVNKWPQFCEAECLKILKCKKYRCLQQFIRITLDKTMIKYRHTGTWWLLPRLDYSWGINIDDLTVNYISYFFGK
jgi:hypothetical protein